MIHLERGSIIDNKTLQRIFKCGIQGGMRISKKEKSLVLISDHTKGIYDDRWVGGILYYTGMGLRGDQKLEFSGNKYLLKSKSLGIDVHLFEVFEKGKYLYQGRVELAEDPFLSRQKDIDGVMRNVWIFPLRLIDGPPLPIQYEVLKKKEERKERISKTMTTDQLLEKVRSESSIPVGQRNVVTMVYERDPYVAEYVKRRAQGKCQLCSMPAPFYDKDGTPYLETHHIIWLSRGGTDSIDNTVALCPNCHRKMHVLDDPDDIEKLKQSLK